MIKKKFIVEGMTCSACQNHVEKAVSKVEGTKNVKVNLLTKTMDVEIDNENKVNKINEAVEKAGYHSFLANKEKEATKETATNDDTKRLITKLVLSLMLLVMLFYISMGYMMGWPLGAISEKPLSVALVEMILSFSIVTINKRFFISGTKGLIHGGPNMDTLVALGSGTAFIYSIVVFLLMTFNFENINEVTRLSMNLSFETAGMIPALITIGKTLESLSKDKTTNAIKDLVKLVPKTATVIRDNKEITINAEDVFVDEIFVVKPGLAFPADGIVVSGTSSVDESALTGESMPVDKKENDMVYAATINQNGVLICKATKTGSNTSFSQIIELVEEASSSKAPISRIADKISGIFVPVVMVVSFVVFMIWLIVGLTTGLNVQESTLAYSINRAVSVLVISCPCALGLATPVAIMVGSGKAAKENVLFKTAEALEKTGKTDIVVLDKTGTITEGKPVVTGVKTKLNEEDFLRLVLSLEINSSHPLAKSIVSYIKDNYQDIHEQKITDFKEIPGTGVECVYENKKLEGINAKTAEEKYFISEEYYNFINDASKSGKTTMVFVLDKEVIGSIIVSDQIKDDSKQAIEELIKSGITPVMLTGDNEKTAQFTAKQIGIDYWAAGVVPQQKGEIIQKLKTVGNVMMVGDGINDSLALTLADTGVAIGAGTEVAIDSADIVLAKSSLMDVVKAIRLSRQTIKNIKENLFWAFFYNIIMIPIAAGAFYGANIEWLKELKPWYGAAAMSVSSLIVVLNALRLNLFNSVKNINKRKEVTIPENLLNINIKSGENEMKKEIFVEGMMCAHCKKRVEDAAMSIEGVKKAEASLEEKKLVVEGGDNFDLEAIKKAITDAGYIVK